MEINYEKSVGAYIRQLLEQRGLISLKKKELWEILGISKRHETFRKIIFEYRRLPAIYAREMIGYVIIVFIYILAYHF